MCIRDRRVGEPAEREGFPLMLAGLQELGIDITCLLYTSRCV